MQTQPSLPDVEAAPEANQNTEYENAVEYLCDVDMQYDEGFVKDNLEEILVLLLHECGAANGKKLTDRVSDVFGTVISSGTLYPKLYDLEDEGILNSAEHIRTKEYSIADEDKAQDMIRSWLTQLFAVGGAIHHL